LNQSPAFGLIAEEVAEVNSTLVARNSDRQPESVHYETVNAMLLNEFLREHDVLAAEVLGSARLSRAHFGALAETPFAQPKGR
jgi:hypothetical protein